jgi:hypothetical protein
VPTCLAGAEGSLLLSEFTIWKISRIITAEIIDSVRGGRQISGWTSTTLVNLASPLQLPILHALSYFLFTLLTFLQSFLQVRLLFCTYFVSSSSVDNSMSFPNLGGSNTLMSSNRSAHGALAVRNGDSRPFRPAQHEVRLMSSSIRLVCNTSLTPPFTLSCGFIIALTTPYPSEQGERPSTRREVCGSETPASVNEGGVG